MSALRPLALVLTLLAPLAACKRGEPADASAASTAPPTDTAIVLTSPHEVAALRERGRDHVVIDVNPRELYDDGHVPGARWMRFDAIDRAMLPADRAVPVVLYCYNEQCGASHQAATAVVAAGWKDVRRMPAGILGWRAAGLPIEGSR